MQSIFRGGVSRTVTPPRNLLRKLSTLPQGEGGRARLHVARQSVHTRGENIALDIMALDPSVKAFLDQMALMPGPKMFDLPPEAGRAMFVAMMQMIGPKDVPIGSVKNLDADGVPLRLYRPVASGGSSAGAGVRCSSPASSHCEGEITAV